MTRCDKAKGEDGARTEAMTEALRPAAPFAAIIRIYHAPPNAALRRQDQ